MASSPTAVPPTEAVEARADGLPRAEGTRCAQGRGLRGRPLHAKVVAQLGLASELGHAETFLRRAGGPPARPVTSTVRTAGCGPACPVVWEGSGGTFASAPYPDLRCQERTVWDLWGAER